MPDKANNPKKSPARRNPSTQERILPGILDHLSAEESKTVLHLLLGQQPGLQSETERLATGLLAALSVEEIAEEAVDAMNTVDMESLSARAGKHSWGYVEPGEAAWELLEESLEVLVEDMRRRIALGMIPAAVSICAGLVLGLYECRGTETEGALAWAPDFAAEEAGCLVAELIRRCPRERRRQTSEKLLTALDDRIPEWNDMIRRELSLRR